LDVERPSGSKAFLEEIGLTRHGDGVVAMQHSNAGPGNTGRDFCFQM
jgi:hypothetical protein